MSFFSVFDFTKTVKQARDRILLCASIRQKSSQYGIILQSYCNSKKGAIFMLHSVEIRSEERCMCHIGALAFRLTHFGQLLFFILKITEYRHAAVKQ